MNPEHRHEALGLLVDVSNAAVGLHALAGRVRKGRKNLEFAELLSSVAGQLTKQQNRLTNYLMEDT